MESCSIITTTEANSLVSRVHDRIPVIISPESYGILLDPIHADSVEVLLRPWSSYKMELYPVSGMANSAKNDAWGCLELEKCYKLTAHYLSSNFIRAIYADEHTRITTYNISIINKWRDRTFKLLIKKKSLDTSS